MPVKRDLAVCIALSLVCLACYKRIPVLEGNILNFVANSVTNGKILYMFFVVINQVCVHWLLAGTYTYVCLDQHFGAYGPHQFSGVPLA